MMIGSYRWNLIAGGIGFLGTLLVSFPNNIWQTALIQSSYSFLFLFFFLFLIRWLIGILLHSNIAAPVAKGNQAEESAPSHKGQSIDLTTPPEDVPILGFGNSEESGGFVPLNPPKLATKLNSDPEELAKALRRMTDE